MESEGATATAADRANRLLVENWVERHAVVLCFENAAMRQPNVQDKGVMRIERDVQDATDHPAGPMNRAFRFLKRTSVHGGAVLAEGELLGPVTGGVVLSGEVAAEPAGDGFISVR